MGMDKLIYRLDEVGAIHVSTFKTYVSCKVVPLKRIRFDILVSAIGRCSYVENCRRNQDRAAQPQL